MGLFGTQRPARTPRRAWQLQYATVVMIGLLGLVTSSCTQPLMAASSLANCDAAGDAPHLAAAPQVATAETPRPGIGRLHIDPPALILEVCGQYGGLAGSEPIRLVAGSSRVRAQQVTTGGTDTEPVALLTFPAFQPPERRVEVYNDDTRIATFHLTDAQLATWQTCQPPTRPDQSVRCGDWTLIRWPLSDLGPDDNGNIAHLVVYGMDPASEGQPTVYELTHPSNGTDTLDVLVALLSPHGGTLTLAAVNSTTGFHELDPPIELAVPDPP